MNVSLLPVDLDAFIPDQHKGKEVTAAAGRWVSRVLSALLGVRCSTGSSAGNVQEGLIPTHTCSGPRMLLPLPVSEQIMCISDSGRGGDSNLFRSDRCVQG